MDNIDKVISVILTLVVLALIGSSVFFKATPTGRAMWNNWFHAVQEADDDTNYETKKHQTCKKIKKPLCII